MDAIVYIAIHTERLDSTPVSPLLCGRRERVYWPGDDPSGRVTAALALCLGVVVSDMEDRDLYRADQLLEFVDTYAEQTHASRPLDERLRDLARIEAAIEAAVGPLARVWAEP